MPTYIKPANRRLASPRTRTTRGVLELPYDLRNKIRDFVAKERLSGFSHNEGDKIAFFLTDDGVVIDKLAKYERRHKYAHYLMYYPALDGDDLEQNALDLYASILYHYVPGYKRCGGIAERKNA